MGFLLSLVKKQKIKIKNYSTILYNRITDHLYYLFIKDVLLTTLNHTIIYSEPIDTLDELVTLINLEQWAKVFNSENYHVRINTSFKNIFSFTSHLLSIQYKMENNIALTIDDIGNIENIKLDDFIGIPERGIERGRDDIINFCDAALLFEHSYEKIKTLNEENSSNNKIRVTHIRNTIYHVIFELIRITNK